MPSEDNLEILYYIIDPESSPGSALNSEENCPTSLVLRVEYGSAIHQASTCTHCYTYQGI